MFKTQYQGGPFVEIFSAQGKNAREKWKILGSPSAIRKEYDKEVKGFVFVLEGSCHINKMQLPKQTSQTLGLFQQFLTLQIFVPLGQDFSTDLLITDLGNTKRRLYLSTVHKKLSVSSLHAKIPLFTIKRKIWCNVCIDLVAFTSEIFRGAVFQSLDGIIISANCKLRKIFTLKSKPEDTAGEDDPSFPFVPHEPLDDIPVTCQLNRDVPQVTQLLDLTKIQKAEVKCISPVTEEETDPAIQTWETSASQSKSLGPPPSSNRRVSTKLSREKTKSLKVTNTQDHKNNRASQPQSSRKGTKPVQGIKRWEQCNHPLDREGKGNLHQRTKDLCQNASSVIKGQGNKCSNKAQDASHRESQPQSSRKGTKPVQGIKRWEQCNHPLDREGKGNPHQRTKDLCQSDPAIQTQETSESGRAGFQLASQGPSADKNSHRRTESPLKIAAETTLEIKHGGKVFPESSTECIQLEKSARFVVIEDLACHDLTSSQNASVEHHIAEMGDHQVNNNEIFTFSSIPRSASHGKSPSISSECCIFPLDVKQDSDRVCGKIRIEEYFQRTDSSEEYDNSEFIQGTEKLEISSSSQGTFDSDIFKEIPLNRMSRRNEDWKNKGHSKHNFEETMLAKPQSSTVRKTDSAGCHRTLKPTFSLSPTQSKSEIFKVIPNGSEKNGRHGGVPGQLKRSISKMSLKNISREDLDLATQTCEYDWKNYQPNRVSSSELQMLASMKKQQNEELQDTEISHELSTLQIDNCNVSISTASDDTATWNSCFPPPISQEHHYQKEMSPLSPSNPRDWLNMFSPPIIPGTQQLEEHTKASTNWSIPGEDDFNGDDDDEILTLLYDPCLNCYFDPNSGKYYELA